LCICWDEGELSPNSPVKELKSFPQDLVLVGRATILIKGLSSRLGIPWSLCKEWAPIARNVLELDRNGSGTHAESRVRFGEVWGTLKRYGRGKLDYGVKKLPPSIRTRVAALVVRRQERKDKKKKRRA
jgi:hypothetical protein